MDHSPNDIFIRPQYMPLPIPWHMMKPNMNKLIVELGFGRGEYLVTLSKQFPQALIVGFEVSMTSLLKASYRLVSNNITNVKLVLFDGLLGLSEFFEDSSIDRVYINFPVPWPKKKHAKRRIIRDDFWRILARVMKVGGVLELMTDVGWYAKEGCDSANALGVFEVEIEKNPNRRVRTKYEEKWLAMGRDTYLLRVVKREEYEMSDYDRLFIRRGTYMPHIFVRKEWDLLRDDLISLENMDIDNSTEARFGIREVFIRNKEALLRSYTVDKGFFQTFYIWVRPDDDMGSNVFIIKLDPTTLPFRTRSLMNLMRFIKESVGDEFVIRHNL